jgi:hypothetical protein
MWFYAVQLNVQEKDNELDWENNYEDLMHFKCVEFFCFVSADIV